MVHEDVFWDGLKIFWQTSKKDSYKWQNTGLDTCNSGVPKSFVLAPIIFIIHLNNPNLDLLSKTVKFVADTKLGCKTGHNINHDIIQKELSESFDWLFMWQLGFLNKCKVMHVGFCNKNLWVYLRWLGIRIYEGKCDLVILILSAFKKIGHLALLQETLIQK